MNGADSCEFMVVFIWLAENDVCVGDLSVSTRRLSSMNRTQWKCVSSGITPMTQRFNPFRNLCLPHYFFIPSPLTSKKVETNTHWP